MAFTKFTVEGDVVLGYFASEPVGRDRSVSIDHENSDDRPPSIAGAGDETSIGQGVEDLISRTMGFPNDNEFEEMHQRMEQLREQELQPAEGTPDITREGVRLRITVEVIE